MQKLFLNFNKEIIFGECGAFVGANVVALLSSKFISNPMVISIMAVAGTLIGGALFWLGARIYDKNKIGKFKKESLASDIYYFTPAALLFSLIIYDPILYFVSNTLLNQSVSVESSVITGQLIAFCLFLLAMNIYRVILFKIQGKQL